MVFLHDLHAATFINSSGFFDLNPQTLEQTVGQTLGQASGLAKQMEAIRGKLNFSEKIHDLRNDDFWAGPLPKPLILHTPSPPLLPHASFEPLINDQVTLTMPLNSDLTPTELMLAHLFERFEKIRMYATQWANLYPKLALKLGQLHNPYVNEWINKYALLNQKKFLDTHKDISLQIRNDPKIYHLDSTKNQIYDPILSSVFQTPSQLRMSEQMVHNLRIHLSKMLAFEADPRHNVQNLIEQKKLNSPLGPELLQQKIGEAREVLTSILKNERSFVTRDHLYPPANETPEFLKSQGEFKVLHDRLVANKPVDDKYLKDNFSILSMKRLSALYEPDIKLDQKIFKHNEVEFKTFLDGTANIVNSEIAGNVKFFNPEISAQSTLRDHLLKVPKNLKSILVKAATPKAGLAID